MNKDDKSPDTYGRGPAASPEGDTARVRSLKWIQTVSPIVGGTRHERIEIAAYYLSEKRGFIPGYELEDWAKAQALVESLEHD